MSFILCQYHLRETTGSLSDTRRRCLPYQPVRRTLPPFESVDGTKRLHKSYIQYTSTVFATPSTPHEITRLQPAYISIRLDTFIVAHDSQLEGNIRLNARLKVRRILLGTRPPILVHEVLCEFLYDLGTQLCELDHSRRRFSKVTLERVLEERAPVRCAAGENEAVV